MTVEFYDLGYSADNKFSVIISKDENGYVFVKHRERDTWEIPGGHIEPGETAFEAAKRELMEETGAKTFKLSEVCLYSVNRGDSNSFGSLFYAEITEYSDSLDHEIEVVKSFPELPKELTYPAIQPFLFNEVLNRITMQYETPRLILRKPFMSDAEEIFRNYAQDPEVTRYLIWKPHDNQNMTNDWVSYCIESWDVNKSLPFVIWHKETEQTIGMIDFRIDDFKIHFGYVLAKAFWNQEIMTEAGIPIIKALLERDGIYRIEAVHDLDNPASGKVMEKLGMKYEGVVRRYSLHPAVSDIPRDCKMYSIVK